MPLAWAPTRSLFVIDLDKFSEAGVDVPKPDWTWKDFFEEIKHGDPRQTWKSMETAAGLEENPQNHQTRSISRWGVGLYSDDGKALGFTDTQAPGGLLPT